MARRRSLPTVIREKKAEYTPEARRAKIEGNVVLEGVVMADGTLGAMRVVKSLDTTYGLDEQAIKAAKEWRFTPGTKDGKPVPVKVTIEMTFTLR